MKRASTLVIAAALLAATPSFAATTFAIDPNHSDVSFQIRHLMSKVRGIFNEFSGTIVRDDEDVTKSTVELAIKAASVDTRNDTRDEDLRSDHFFEVAKYPEITFKSTGVEKVSDSKLKVTGELSMHGVTRVVTLDVDVLGEMKDARGTLRAGYALEVTLDRKEFGINWNRALDSGGYLLSDEVDVAINIEARQQ